MARIAVLGATGSLGSHVAQQAAATGHAVTAVVRTPDKLPAELRARVCVEQADLAVTPQARLSELLGGHDAVINTAGTVTDGVRFVALVARVVASLEALAPAQRPVAWFLAGAGVLDLDDTGRRGVDLPVVKAKYWPHAQNLKRLQDSSLDWRLLCPGPMIEGEAIGLAHMRVRFERLPVALPSAARWLPRALLLPLFARIVPEMIVPYADAAALMLSYLAPAGPASRRRVGLALPPGMRGTKPGWMTPR